MSNHATAFSETLVDEWVRAGLRFAFVAPGSRSTPLALALAGRGEVHTEVVLDERAAAFMALGVGLRLGVPAVVLTTSGTATTHVHAAVVEAHLAEVPLLVCTADRPPELYDVGAPQTIDQRRLFGDAARAYIDLGVPDAANRGAWRSVGARTWLATVGSPPGPVQLNAAFREPLLSPSDPAPGSLGAGRAVGGGGAAAGADPGVPGGRSDGRPWHRRSIPQGPDPQVVAELAQRWAGQPRGVLLAGAGVEDPGPVLALAARLGWPVLADPRSPCRLEHPLVVAHADALLRVDSLASTLTPQVIVTLGSPPASKVLTTWLARCSDPAGSLGSNTADRVLVNRGGSWWDPDRLAALVVSAPPGAFAAAVLAALTDTADVPGVPRVPVLPVLPDLAEAAEAVDQASGWLRRWRGADDLVEQALVAALGEGTPPGGDAVLAGAGPVGGSGDHPALAGLSEPALARAVYRAAHGQGAALVVSSSMPVRDLEWFAPRLGQLHAAPAPLVLANRGANGIDGVVATAAGAALASGSQEVWLLIGDLALLHDAGTLLGLVRRPLRLRIVVADNRGGGIFSFLPQAQLVEPERFELLFGTPMPLDPADLLALHGVDCRVLATAEGDAAGGTIDAALEQLAASAAPVAALVVRCPDRAVNVAVHAGIGVAVARALAEAEH
ncbi:MAG: 2-succinyl-5-enolpyruvyl-6-hydroxy-3-cyclohexene-1-carboxylic-acid synthase [Acidimicrobiales bacterium]